MADLRCDRMAIAGRDFSFAFNDSKFSDRILQIELMPEPDRGGHGDEDRCDYNIADSVTEIIPEEENADTNASSCFARVRSIHVGSAILAEMSPFFHKLFSNGMRGSEERNITLRISCSEEVAFMDLLQFMYSGKLVACSITTLLDVLIIADKFLVTRCVDYCLTALDKFPISIETAFLYLELPQCIQCIQSYYSERSLMERAKDYLMFEFAHIQKIQCRLNEVDLRRLPLTDIDVLIVESEDALSDFFIKWFRKHYTNFEERKEILGTKLWPLTSFPNFDIDMFKHRSFSTDSDHVCVSKAVLKELLLKADAHERELSAATLTVMELEAPVRHCTTFWDITKENFQRLLFQVETCVYSLYFQFISTNFQLSAANVSISGDCEFGVSIWPNRDAERQLNPLQSAVIAYEFAVRQEPSFDFESLIQSQFDLSLGRTRYISWQYSPGYFEKDICYINNMVQFRLQLSLMP